MTSYSGEMHNTHTRSSNSSSNLVVATTMWELYACGLHKPISGVRHLYNTAWLS